MHYLYANREDFSNLYTIIWIFVYLSVFVYVFILIPAAFNVSLGLLNIYIRLLLFFFDWGKQKVLIRKRQKEIETCSGSDDSGIVEPKSISDTISADNTDTSNQGNSPSLANQNTASQNTNENQHRNEETNVDEVACQESELESSSEFLESEGGNLNSDYAKLIDKQDSIGLAEYCRKLYEPCYERLLTDQRLDLSDISFYVKSGVDSIVQDDVTQRFQAEELKSWNFLTRTNHIYKHDMGFRLSVIWIFGFLFRYLVLFPIRAIIFIIGVGTYANCTLIVSFIPQSKAKDALSKRLSLMSYRVLCRGFSAIVRFHNRENLPKGGGVCVANHTSPIDALILSCDNCYVLIGQRHGGFTGFMQNAMSRLASHVWFERSQKSDREGVIKKVAEHASDPSKTPILIFPEGTCINNTSVMMFRKGSFEYSDLIYPVAIKYDARFGDAFWNSSKHPMLRVAEHASDPSKTPILIFPEGTCINNTSVMMFRKGSFEYSDLIYPVAIKYDARFGDAFWNSSKHPMLRYLLHMMTSWAIVCDVWYLPPARRLPGEDVVSFAYRVKRLIARRGGLVDLEWDGNLKRSKVNPLHLDKLKQRTFAQTHTRTSCNNLTALDHPTSNSTSTDVNSSTQPTNTSSSSSSANNGGQQEETERDQNGNNTTAHNIVDSNKLKLL